MTHPNEWNVSGRKYYNDALRVAESLGPAHVAVLNEQRARQVASMIAQNKEQGAA